LALPFQGWFLYYSLTLTLNLRLIAFDYFWVGW
jgi:hypothetical protein